MNAGVVSAVAVATREAADVCGPCHPDANCIHSFDGKRPGYLLADVTGYKNPEVVHRVAEKLGCSIEEAQSVFNEMLQYLAAAAVAPVGASKAPTKDVDVAWHEFVLFTRDYLEFCRVHFGFFVHHVPTPRLSQAAA